MRRSPGGVARPAVDGGIRLAIEAKLMQTALEQGVPEPEIFYVTKPEDGLGEAFLMEWIDGETRGARIVRSEVFEKIRPKLARQCGEILARIHATDLKKTGLDQDLKVIDPKTLVEQTWDQYQRMNTPQPMIDYTARWLKNNLPKEIRTTLVHSDFRNGNIMVSPQKGIVAVLDWELSHIGDPMRDLGWICTNSWRFGNSGLPVGGFGQYEDLFQGYEELSGIKVDPGHVKFWEVFGSFWWAVGCLQMTDYYRRGLDNTVERVAIGRRTSECQIDCVNLLIPGSFTLMEKQFAQSTEMPRIDELIISVRDFLREEIMSQTKGRTKFMARVASNSLDIVLRDMMTGPAHRREELRRLQSLLKADGTLEALRWQLVHGLRNETISLDQEGLAEHLRTTVANQVAIDQAGYSGLKAALAKTEKTSRR
jgi:aminoglycoside phosphotransferase (APT) family kinase protein